MKIAISTSGVDLDAPVDPRFGRAGRFLVFDTETGRFVTVDNTQNLQAAQGAGIQAAQNVVATGAGVVLTGNCGPKAFRVLRESGVAVCISAQGTVQKALDDYLAGLLKPADEANVEGHWM